MANKRTKQVGQIIIVVLSVSIFFFLLLPFLEQDSVDTKEGTAKKATPQIFTSNPLSELARKIYAMFSGKHRSNAPHIPSQATSTAVEGENRLALAPSTETERFSAEHEGNSQTSSVGVTYDEYGDAGFINEDGEWVLIRQTAPETAERGMHEVSTTDKAYDKYVRMERAAKYTAQTSSEKTDIPQSKWARLWKPIKNLFSREEDTPSVEQTDTEKSFALASASAGLGKDRDIRTSRNRKTPKPDLGGDMQFSLNNNGQDLLTDILNPELGIQETAEQLKEQARQILGEDSPQYKEVAKKIDINTNKSVKEVRANIQTAYENRLQKAVDAQRSVQDPTITDLCLSTSAKSLYGCGRSIAIDSESLSISDPQNELELDEEVKYREIYREKTGKEMPFSHAGHAPNVMVVFSQTDGQKAEELFASLPPATEQEYTIRKEAFQYLQEGAMGDVSPEVKEEAEILVNQALLAAMYKEKGCEHKQCYAIMLDGTPNESTKQSAAIARAAGTNINVPDTEAEKGFMDPLHRYNQDQISQFLNNTTLSVPEEFIDTTNPQAGSQTENQIEIKYLSSGLTAFPSVGFYDENDLKEGVQKNKPQKDANGKYTSTAADSYLIITPTANLADRLVKQANVPVTQVMVQIPSSTRTETASSPSAEKVMDLGQTPGEIFKKDVPTEDQVDNLKNAWTGHLALGQEIVQQSRKKLTQTASTDILQASAEQTQKQITKQGGLTIDTF